MKQDMIMLILAIIFIVIMFGTTMSITVRAKGLKKAYWLLCSFLIGIGSLSFIYFLAFPEHPGFSANRPAGEIPPELMFAATLTRTGIAAALLGFLVHGIWRLIGFFGKRDAS
ncbi:hypothetical protein [Rouxiella badensis]|uniref:hypothetical protein n=1 Tax=Rouxiella badensis TaxID=1646377 RepID=UPI0022AA8330|nr:hypothetical protein [Rouxiella badensis]WAT09453.1 hypothetical protein O1V65_02395 [Rouxiella badensis]